MNKNYKKDEAALMTIARTHVASIEEGGKVEIVFYYKYKKDVAVPHEKQPLLRTRSPEEAWSGLPNIVPCQWMPTLVYWNDYSPSF